MSFSSRIKRRWHDSHPAKSPLNDPVPLVQDVVQIIAECLYSDVPTLKSGSLVSRIWHAAFIPVLFRQLVITGAGADNASDIVIALDEAFSRSPYMTRHLQSLTFASSVPIPSRGLSLAALQCILHKASILRSLTLHVPISKVDIVPSPLLPPCRLERLEIGSWILRTEDEGYVSRLLRLFTSVDELVFSSGTNCDVKQWIVDLFGNSKELMPVPQFWPLRVRRLTFAEACGYQCVSSVMGLFPLIADIDAVTTLSVAAPLLLSSLVHAVNMFLLSAKNVLEFHIAFDVCHRGSDAWHNAIATLETMGITARLTTPPDLRGRTNIRHLSISFDVFQRQFMTGTLRISHTQWETALDQLKLAPVGLKTIKMDINVPWSGVHGCSGLSVFAALPWGDLNDALSQFSSLERIDICITPRFVEQERGHVAERLVDIGYFVHRHLSKDKATLTHVSFTDDVI